MNKINLFKTKHAARSPPANTSSNPLVTMKTNTNEHKLLPVTEVSQVLYRARGVWPFDLMPDEIIIEQKRIIVINNYFPFGSDVGTIPMNKLSSIEVTYSLIFSSLVIQNTELHGFHATVKWLTHRDARCIKEIVDGIAVSELSRVDLGVEAVPKVRETLQTLGRI